MVEDGTLEQQQMAALQAQAMAKGTDFETRKRARLTDGSHKGVRLELVLPKEWHVCSLDALCMLIASAPS